MQRLTPTTHPKASTHWAWTGAGVGLAVALITQAPAHWLTRAIEHASGGTLRVQATAIDAGGHRTEAVKNFVRARRIRRPHQRNRLCKVADKIASIRPLNESAHKRLVDAIHKRTIELSPLNAG